MKRALSLLLILAMLLPSVLLPTAAETASVSPTEETLPAYTGTHSSITYTDTYNDCLLMTVKGTARAAFEDYLTLLRSNGFAPVTGTETRRVLGTDNLSAMLTGSVGGASYFVNAFFDSVAGESKITVEPLGARDLSVFDPASARKGTIAPLLIQVGTSNDGATSHSGMSELYRLSDGSFVIFDGGGGSLGDSSRDREMAARLYQTMAKYNSLEHGGAGGDIRIAAWYISHPHIDHMGGFMAFTDLCMSIDTALVLENVICYLPNVETQSQAVVEGTDYSLSPYKLGVYNARLEELKEKGTSVFKAHVGQMYYFSDMTLEILFTYDLLTPDTLLPNQAAHSELGVSKNDLSNSFSVISRAVVNGHSAIWTGDATSYAIQKINGLFAHALRSEIVQVPHHGHTQMSSTNGQQVVDLFFGDNRTRSELEADAKRLGGSANSSYKLLYKQNDGYGYVRAEYILFPNSHLDSQAQKLFDGAKYHGSGNPVVHLLWEARAAGGDVYFADHVLTVFDLSQETLTSPVIDDTVLKSGNTPLPQRKHTVSTLEELRAMNRSTDRFELTEDIKVTGAFSAALIESFNGTLDGKGHTIDLSEATFTLDGSGGALFKNLTDATVQNLKIVGANIVQVCKNSGSNTGILAAKAGGEVLVYKVQIKGSITDRSTVNANIGGFFGQTDATATVLVDSCSFDGRIIGENTQPSYAGAFFGRAGAYNAGYNTILIKSCSADGLISHTNAGGLIGRTNTTGTVKILYSVNRAEVKAESTPTAAAGGLIAKVERAELQLLYSVVAAKVNAAGAVGEFFAAGTPTLKEILGCTAFLNGSTAATLPKAETGLLVRKGMRLRVDGKGLGLRYDITADASLIAGMRVLGYTVEYGALIAPKASVDAAGGSFTHESMKGNAFTDVISTDTDNVPNEYYTADLPLTEAELRTEFVSVGYICLIETDAAGTVTNKYYIYSAYEPQNVRTASAVAGAALADPSNGLTAAEIDVLQAYRR